MKQVENLINRIKAIFLGIEKGEYMSKAALFIDMPETCLDCRFCREIDEGIEACCEVMDEPDDNTLCRMIDCKDGYCQNKPEWCPLQEVN